MTKPIILGLIAIVAVIVAIAGCTNSTEAPGQANTTLPNAECATDSDCAVGGCSGQVCTMAKEAPGLITTCEYMPQYGCLKLTGCGCIEGKCAWKQNQAYTACLENITQQ